MCFWIWPDQFRPHWKDWDCLFRSIGIILQMLRGLWIRENATAAVFQDFRNSWMTSFRCHRKNQRTKQLWKKPSNNWWLKACKQFSPRRWAERSAPRTVITNNCFEEFQRTPVLLWFHTSGVWIWVIVSCLELFWKTEFCKWMQLVNFR